MVISVTSPQFQLFGYHVTLSQLPNYGCSASLSENVIVPCTSVVVNTGLENLSPFHRYEELNVVCLPPQKRQPAALPPLDVSHPLTLITTSKLKNHFSNVTVPTHYHHEPINSLYHSPSSFFPAFRLHINFVIQLRLTTPPSKNILPVLFHPHHIFYHHLIVRPLIAGSYRSFAQFLL